MIYTIIYCQTDLRYPWALLSIAIQWAICRSYCKRTEDWDSRVIIDMGQSGATLERPGLSRVRALVATKQVAYVVVSDIDRLSQHTEHQQLLSSEFFKAYTLVSVARNHIS